MEESGGQRSDSHEQGGVDAEHLLQNSFLPVGLGSLLLHVAEMQLPPESRL